MGALQSTNETVAKEKTTKKLKRGGKLKSKKKIKKKTLNIFDVGVWFV